MTTRLALILALVLLALAAAQWHLRSISAAPGAARPISGQAESPGEATREEQDDDLGEVEEPHIEIPEYVPPAVTERPRPPMGFGVDSVQVELSAPRIGGATEEAPAGRGRD